MEDSEHVRLRHGPVVRVLTAEHLVTDNEEEQSSLADPDGPTRLVAVGPHAAIWHRNGTVLTHRDVTGESVDQAIRESPNEMWTAFPLDGREWPTEILETFPGLDALVENFGEIMVKALEDADELPQYLDPKQRYPDKFAFTTGRMPHTRYEWEVLERMVDAYWGLSARLSDMPGLDEIRLLPVTQREWEMLLTATYFSDPELHQHQRSPHEYVLRQLFSTIAGRMKRLGVTSTPQEIHAEVARSSFFDTRIRALTRQIFKMSRWWRLRRIQPIDPER